MLLSFFEYWHNVKLNQYEQSKAINAGSEACGEYAAEQGSLLQYHTIHDLQRGLLFFYGKDAISGGVNLLKNLGFISIHSSPYMKTDRTRFFMFYPEIVNNWIETNNAQILNFTSHRKSENAKSENRLSNLENKPLHALEAVDASADNRKTVNTKTSSLIPPRIGDGGIGGIEEFWAIPLPQPLQQSRDALVAAARKAGRSAQEMRAAGLAAILVPGARDFASLAIAKLKDPHWIAPPIKNDVKKNVQETPEEKTTKDVVNKYLSEAKLTLNSTANRQRDVQAKEHGDEFPQC